MSDESQPVSTEPTPLQTQAGGSPTGAIPEPARNTPGTLVLQWLTYAFWGWTVLALTWLTALSVSFFINRSDYNGDDGSGIAYSLAAVIVLFVISVICDWLYSKREPLPKHGASMVIMIIHAVIFALFGIGAVIAAVFAIVNMFIGSESSTDGPLTVLITSLIIAVVYGATLLRTLRPLRIRRITLVYGAFMALIVSAITVLGIVGPVIFAASTKDDRLIERGLVEVSEAVRNHTAKADALPKSLQDIREAVTGDGRQLIDRGMVEYVPGNEVSMSGSPTLPPAINSDTAVFDYTLCVTYKAKKGGDYIRTQEYTERQVSPDTYAHPAGRVCYELTTSFRYIHDQ